MTINEGLRLIAGLFIILSLIASQFLHPDFIYFTAFIGLNLLQSAFTGWCPMMWVLNRLGFAKECIVKS